MAKNDIVLLDGILEERISKNIPSDQKDEVFEFLATEQILKDLDLSNEEILLGSVDGRNDGGIDEFFIFINGHLLTDCESFFWPKTGGKLEVRIITCKHHDTFKQQVLDSFIASISELFDFGISENNLKGDYNDEILEKRRDFIYAYKKLSSVLTHFNIDISYASRGDTELIGDSINSRKKQLVTICKNLFSRCNISFSFWGCSEILQAYRKAPKYSLELIFQEYLSQGEQYVLLARLEDYYNFITNEDGNLRKYLFDSNVRDYMGLNRVNVDIINTLVSSKNSNFWWLNNGITILASHANIVGNTINIDNIQIVNGLQTSESIYKYYSDGYNDTINRSVLIKIIVTNNSIIRDDIIRATNNQTEVSVASLHATDKIQRDIEEILLLSGIYYERRINYYSNQGIPKNLIVSPLYLASAYVSLILKKPYRAINLKQKFMNNEQQYTLVFSEKTDIRIWPILAHIMRKTDFELEKFRPKGTISTENFIKCTRQIIAFLTISRMFKTFNFNINDLLKFDLSSYTTEELKITFEIINEIAQGSWQKSLFRKKKYIENICLHAAQKYNILEFESFSLRIDLFDENKKQFVIDDDNFLHQVNSLLPPQPWKRGIHEEIAKQLKCSPGVISKVINILIERRIRYKQYKGVVYDFNGNIIKNNAKISDL